MVAASFEEPETGRVLKRPAFGAAAAEKAARASAAFGNVPGVDDELPAAGTAFLRGERGSKGELVQDAVQAAEEKNFEILQTPSYIRRYKS